MERPISRSICLVSVLLLAADLACAAPKNFVFILVDDLGQKDIGVEGSTFYETPHIELIHYYEDRRNELYELQQDPGEQHDRLAAHPEIARALSNQLGAWLRDRGASIPEQDGRFDPARKRREIQDQKTQQLEELERRHARYFQE